MKSDLEPDLVCPCGYENFERVVVERVAGRPIVTDFVACVGCRAVYLSRPSKSRPPPAGAPLIEGPRRPPSLLPAAFPAPAHERVEYAFPNLHNNYPRGYVNPARVDSNEALKRDSAEAAKDYRKPWRSPPLKPGGRR